MMRPVIPIDAGTAFDDSTVPHPIATTGTGSSSGSSSTTATAGSGLSSGGSGTLGLGDTVSSVVNRISDGFATLPSWFWLLPFGLIFLTLFGGKHGHKKHRG